MARVKLGNVAKECRQNWSGDTDNVPVVGLEHLVPGDVTLSKWEGSSDNTFTKKFEKGQVLLGRRRVYLKKAVLAPFDGICSGDITVIEAIPDKILPELLPFIIQNERFFDYAEQGSAGSLSPRVKWEHLKDYEFELPGLSEQKKLSDELWAAYRLKQSYQALIVATDELVKSRFIEMFGDPVNNPKRWPVMTMKESSVLLSDGPFGSNLKSDHYSETGIRVIRLQNICQGFFDDTDKAYVSEEHYRLLQKYTCKPGDIVIGTLGEPNLRACIIPSTVPISINKADCVHYIPKPNLLNTIFACAYINSPGLLYIASSNLHGTTRSRIAAGQVNQLPIYIPAIERQLEFARFYKQADKSKFSDFKSRFIAQFENPDYMRYSFDDICYDDTKSATKIPASEYLAQGSYPIYDQATDSIIAGYSNDSNGVNMVFPAVLFGDHSRVVKYIDRAFYIGADGVKILRPINADLSTEFLYYQLKFKDVPNTGYNRHFKYLKLFSYCCPNAEEQRAFLAICHQADKSKYLN